MIVFTMFVTFSLIGISFFYPVFAMLFATAMIIFFVLLGVNSREPDVTGPTKGGVLSIIVLVVSFGSYIFS
jgi:hypothetical protein